MQTVLFVEPNHEWARIVRQRLPDNVRLLTPPSALNARDVYLSSPRVDVIAFGSTPDSDSWDLLDWLRQRPFSGPILVASDRPREYAVLRGAGCTHIVDPKEELPNAIRRLLNLPHASPS